MSVTLTLFLGGHRRGDGCIDPQSPPHLCGHFYRGVNVYSSEDSGALVEDGHSIVSAPVDGPYGRTFAFADPDGYHVTLHDQA